MVFVWGELFSPPLATPLTPCVQCAHNKKMEFGYESYGGRPSPRAQAELETRKMKQQVRTWIADQYDNFVSQVEASEVNDILPVGCLDDAVPVLTLLANMSCACLEWWMKVKTYEYRQNLYVRPMKKITSIIMRSYVDETQLPIFHVRREDSAEEVPR